MAYVYILVCDEGKYYVGSTKNLDRRIREHTAGAGKKTRFTRRYTNWKILHTEEFPDSSEARKREKEIKSWKGGNTWKQYCETFIKP